MARILTHEECAIIDGTIGQTSYMISQTAHAQQFDEYLFFIGALNLLTRVKRRGYVDDSTEKELLESGYANTFLAAAFPCSLTFH
jgi:hypothetical protein